jgi:hypothetical protein
MGILEKVPEQQQSNPGISHLATATTRTTPWRGPESPNNGKIFVVFEPQKVDNLP